MAHALASPTTALDEGTLAERIQHYIDRGWAPYPAAEAVIRDLVREGLAEQLLMQYATAPLYELWEASTRPTRAARVASVTKAPQAPRVDCEALKLDGALMESLVQVGGAWTRLGDLNRALCRQGAVEQKRAAYRHARNARLLHLLGERLPDGEVRVRQALSEADLAQIFSEAGR